ncbi:hypothetical protein [Paenibacillus sp. S150]|uniref:hypothetical protein n=1 Tax=Paenibacillus sp. S150 TaxID=2749826 RepID=UPI001C56E37D|nr:hypothetical protein [Paenibacillus sp. S150]MBW4082514.1 hypothetical protein [Paenibacillus sp. S150]
MSEALLPKVVSGYIHASNAHDVEAYLSTFSDSSLIAEGNGQIEKLRADLED